MIKELKISVPEGYEIDKEKSTFEKIVFKKIEEKPWRYEEKKYINGYWIDADSYICPIHDKANTCKNHNVFLTKKQAKSALAMAQISQIMANDKRFGGVVTDEEWNNIALPKFVIDKQYGNGIQIDRCFTINSFLAFHTSKQRDLFLEENEDLVKDYLMIE